MIPEETTILPTEDGLVEVITGDRDGDRVVINLAPKAAAGLAVDIAGVAADLGAAPTLLIERQVSSHATVRFHITKSRNVRLDWHTGGKYHHRLTIDYGRLREIADKLHDFADIIEDRKSQ